MRDTKDIKAKDIKESGIGGIQYSSNTDCFKFSVQVSFIPEAKEFVAQFPDGIMSFKTVSEFKGEVKHREHELFEAYIRVARRQVEECYKLCNVYQVHFTCGKCGAEKSSSTRRYLEKLGKRADDSPIWGDEMCGKCARVYVEKEKEPVPVNKPYEGL